MVSSGHAGLVGSLKLQPFTSPLRFKLLIAHLVCMFPFFKESLNSPKVLSVGPAAQGQADRQSRLSAPALTNHGRELELS